MTLKINDSSRCAAAVAAQALGVAVRAAAPADEIGALHHDIRTARDEPVHRAGFRCDTALGWVMQASTELADTAYHLDRIAAATKPGACLVPWGVCPEHGNTLTSTGRKTWCRETGCGRTWTYDRGGLPYIEPARWRLDLLASLDHPGPARPRLLVRPGRDLVRRQRPPPPAADPADPQRNPQALHRTRPATARTRKTTAMVTMATPPPSHRPSLPLPATSLHTYMITKCRWSTKR
jgi:hypothetical protein